MESKSENVVNSYIGMDDLLNIYKVAYSGLKGIGFSEVKADRYAWFCQAIYKELKDQHDVLDNLQKIATANKLLPGQLTMNFTSGVAAVKGFRLSARVGVAAPFIDRLASIAKKYDIELNECSLGVTKVALDIAGAGTGAVTSVTGIGIPLGIPLLVLNVIATFNDSYSLGKACSS